MMNAHLVEPTALVSLRHISELQGITVSGDGTVAIGAMTRHRTIAAEERLTGAHAALRQAAGLIATPPIRNMGTIGGSIAHADPAADFPPVLCALGAQIELIGQHGRRRVPARAFFIDWFQTVVEPDEMIVSVILPPWAKNSVGVYDKLAKVTGDMAIASVSVALTMEARVCTRAGLAVGGCGPRPVAMAEAESLLVGTGLDAAVVTKAGAILVDACDPVDDTRANAKYRRMVVPRMLSRAISEAHRDLAC
jgi:carbon-monoxide dehydrogenase medium subunit